MHIDRALAVPGLGGYYNEDLDAVRAGAARDGFMYTGAPISSGFERIRQPSEAASIILLLDNGQAVSGDALSVEFSAAGGRVGRFRAQEQLPHLADVCRWLEGRRISDFFEMCGTLEAEPFSTDLHRPAAMYAASQALLQAVAIEQRTTCAEVLATGLNVHVSTTPIALNAQCGEDRRTAVDKAILKEAAALPHGLINSIDDVLGRNGELLLEYISWIVSRIQRYGRDGYRPEIHIDVYGLIGVIFDHDVDRMSAYLISLADAASPFNLCLETPALMETRDAQIEICAALRAELAKSSVAGTIQLIVDEWANDIDDIRAFLSAGAADMVNVKSPDLGSVAHTAQAVLECWAGATRPILGGSCTDTDQSARVMAHVALATQPAWVLARPGMGLDEGMQVVHNEMARTLAIIRARTPDL